MKTLETDLAIIGAGPAGSTAAALARKAGLSVVILEKESFPRFRIGESLLPNANALLRESGVWPAVESAGFVRKYGAYFFTANGAAEKEVVFSNGLIGGLDYTYQVERARFDALLLDHARSLGADVRLPCHATSYSRQGALVAVAAQGPDEELLVKSRWLFDATGRERSFACPLKERNDPPRLARRVAVYSHFQGVSRPPGRQGGHTVVVRLESGWFWLIPLDEERTSVGWVMSVDELRRRKTTPEELFRDTVKASPKLRELLDGAEPVLPFQTTADYSYFRASLADDRTILLGDAGGFFDPIFSSGVYVALRSAKRAVAAILHADAHGRGLTAREQLHYTRDLKEHAGVFERLIQAFYDNSSFSVFMSPRPPFRIDRGINSIVAGHADLTWRLWWRYHVFLAVCRLQKRVRLAEPIEF